MGGRGCGEDVARVRLGRCCCWLLWRRSLLWRVAVAGCCGGLLWLGLSLGCCGLVAAAERMDLSRRDDRVLCDTCARCVEVDLERARVGMMCVLCTGVWEKRCGGRCGISLATHHVSCARRSAAPGLAAERAGQQEVHKQGGASPGACF